MHFVFIDRIVRLEAHRQIVTLKNVAFAEDVFMQHFVGNPVMPASLLIESLAQAATALLEVSNHLRKKALPVMISDAKFRSFVRPGEQLKITVDIVSLDGTSAQLEGTIHSGEKLVASARMVFVLREADEFYPVKTRSLVESTYDYWLKGAELIGVDRDQEKRP